MHYLSLEEREQILEIHTDISDANLKVEQEYKEWRARFPSPRLHCFRCDGSMNQFSAEANRDNEGVWVWIRKITLKGSGSEQREKKRKRGAAEAAEAAEEEEEDCKRDVRFGI